MEECPRELLTPPLLLTALVGASPELNTRLTDALHESGLVAHQHKLVKYLSFSYDFGIPPCKRGCKEAPGYRVGGILKRSWLEKVCSVIPAVLVMCFDWSADPQHSPAEEAQALSHLLHARRQARERELRVLLFAVLHANAPDGQCTALKPQPEGPGLIVARGMEDVAAKATQLERLVYQNAMSFYADEEKRYRKVLTPRLAIMPRWAQSALQVRANLKVAFINEFRRDSRGAMKSYIKAYEQLIHDTEVADAVERLDLCNHITFRMHQLYLQSHEVSSTVHHFRIHVAMLRSCCAEGDEVQAWRRWHWLAANHRLFAELLESVAQHMPSLIDQADMWQFPGFHYQSAAAHVGQLQQWALEALSGGLLPPASGAGGDSLPAPFVGQANTLERMEECNDPAREVHLREAHAQASEVKHGDRRLQLLTRAQATCKERGYSAGVAVCACRTAEEYLAEGNLVASTKLYERLQRGVAEAEPRSSGAWPQWPVLRRFTLERAILCSCRDLGLAKEPAVCHRTRSPPQTPVPVGSRAEALKQLGEVAASMQGNSAGMADAGAGAPDAREDGNQARLSAARQRLLRNAFEYLSLPSTGTADMVSGPSLDMEAELLELVRSVWASTSDISADPGAAVPIEVPLNTTEAEVQFQEDPMSDSDVAAFTLRLRSPVAVPLEIASIVALTSHGEVPLSTAGGAPGSDASEPPTAARPSVLWQGGCLLEVRGSLERATPSEAGIPSITCVRLSWVAAPCVVFTVRSLRQRPSLVPLLSQFQVPSTGIPRPPPGGGASPEGIAWPCSRHAKQLRTQVFSPVDPATALVSEPFVFHVAIFAPAPTQAQRGSRTTTQLWLSCAATSREDPDDRAGQSSVPEELEVALLEQPQGSQSAWGLVPLGADGKPGHAVAELAEDRQLKPMRGSPWVLASEWLEGLPVERDAAEQLLVVPIVVTSRRVCSAVVSCSLALCTSGSGGKAIATVPVQKTCLHFATALHASFEDRPGPQSVGMVRRFVLKSQSSVAVELSGVGTAGPTGEKSPKLEALGPLGSIEPGASHTFVLPLRKPQDCQAEEVLMACLARVDAEASFFPWQGCRKLLQGCRLPSTLLHFPFPGDEPRAGPTGQLHVDLEHASTGAMAEPIEVRVSVRRSSQGAQEVKLRLLRGEGEGPDKFLLGGPTSTQVMLLSAGSLQAQHCHTFTLVPLRSGWLTMPRVQVSAGSQEAISAPASVFVFPFVQPCLVRALA